MKEDLVMVVSINHTLENLTIKLVQARPNQDSEWSIKTNTEMTKE